MKNRPRPIAMLALVMALFALPNQSRGASLVFDPMTSAFPPNPCLPVSGQPFIYVGSYCDGGSCPPFQFANPACAGSATPNQFGLPGVLAVSRRAEISGGPVANAHISTDPRTLIVLNSHPAFAAMELAYTTANLDLVSLGATAFRMHLRGDISPTQPLWCLATIEDFNSPVPFSYATLEVAATGIGDLVLPLVDFVQSAPFPYNGINTLTLVFRDCPVASCSGLYPGRIYSVGEIKIDTSEPTTVERSSWGRLKTIYR